MRLLIINMLTLALLVLGATSASASSVWMTEVGWTSSVTQFEVSDTVRITVSIDADPNIAVLGVGVVADPGLAYDQGLSSTTSYLFYGGKGAYLVATDACGGYPGGAGCIPYPLDPQQVNIEYISSSLPGGSLLGGTAQMVELVFHASAPGAHVLSFRFDPDMGGIHQLGDGSRPPLGLGGDLVVHVIPVPTTALLVGLGLVGLAVAGRRRE